MNSRLHLPHFWLVVGVPIHIRRLQQHSQAHSHVCTKKKEYKESQTDKKKTVEGNKSVMQTSDQVLAFKWGLG